jgi:hypothetical protein
MSADELYHELKAYLETSEKMQKESALRSASWGRAAHEAKGSASAFRKTLAFLESLPVAKINEKVIANFSEVAKKDETK